MLAIIVVAVILWVAAAIYTLRHVTDTGPAHMAVPVEGGAVVPPQTRPFAPGDPVRVPGEVATETWLSMFDEPIVDDDGYIYGRVANAIPDPDGDILIHTLVGEHPLWANPKDVEPVEDSPEGPLP